ncbi:hypothetical protein GCM10027299_09630 [Larkinella ripae]
MNLFRLNRWSSHSEKRYSLEIKKAHCVEQWASKTGQIGYKAWVDCSTSIEEERHQRIEDVTSKGMFVIR